MGIARGGSKLLLMESLKGGFRGSIMQLGRQDMYFSYESLQEQASQEGIALRPLQRITKRANPYYRDIDAIDDVSYFHSLGFDTVHSIDASGFEESTYVHDMNRPVPASLHNRYEVIFDGGTIEHIFHVPNVLENIHSMLKEGGKIIHYTPVHNFVDHGFYGFSPCFFHDYYAANRYELGTCYLEGNRSPLDHFSEPVLFEYTPGSMDQYSVGGLNRETMNGCDMLGVFFSAIKTGNSVSGIIPQQGFYLKAWSKPV